MSWMKGLWPVLLLVFLGSCATEDLTDEIAEADAEAIADYIAQNGLEGTYTLNGNFYSLVSTTDSVVSAIDSLSAAVDSLQATVDDLQLTADSIQVGVDSTQSAIDTLQADSLLTSADSLQLDSLQLVLESLNTEISALQLDSLQLAVDSLQANLDGVLRFPGTSDTVVIAYEMRSILDGGLYFEIPDNEAYSNPYRLGSLISGLSETLVQFSPGQSGILVIPSGQAYGEAGNQSIPPNAVIRVDFTLLDFY